jgi:hypothetical protein
MEKESILVNILASLSVLSGALWIGAYTERLFVTFMMFKEEGLILKDYINDNNLAGILTTISPSIVLSFIFYTVFIISFSLFLVTTKLKLKQNGWLFIITLLVFVTLPFETYLMTFDYKMILEILSGGLNSNYLLGLIIDRFRLLNSFPIIIIFTYLTFPFFIVIKPFILKKKNEN